MERGRRYGTVPEDKYIKEYFIFIYACIIWKLTRESELYVQKHTIEGLRGNSDLTPWQY